MLPSRFLANKTGACERDTGPYFVAGWKANRRALAMDDDLLFDSESKRKQDAVEKVLHYWNGDPRDLYPEHFCETGSCDDTDECADKMVSAAAESGLLCGMRASHCSTNKWAHATRARRNRQEGSCSTTFKEMQSCIPA